MLHYVVPDDVMSRHITSYVTVTLRFVTFRYITLRYVVLRDSHAFNSS